MFRVRILVHDLVNLTTWDGSAGVAADESDGFPLTSTYTPIDLPGDGKVVAYEFQEPNAADNGWLPTQSATAQVGGPASDGRVAFGSTTSTGSSDDARIIGWVQSCPAELPCLAGVQPGPWVRQLS